MPLFQCVLVPSSVGSVAPRVQLSCSRNSICSRFSVGRRHRASAVTAGASATGSAWPLPSAWAAQASASAPPPKGASQPKVVVTREKGKNEQLMQRLKRLGIETVEMPLIKAEPGPDRDRLPEVLASESFDWVCLSSPEAAAVFAEGWRKADCPKVQVAAVGVATERALRYGLQSEFHPSKANAVHFSAELPVRQGGNMKVLYPASVRASTDLQQGLAERGFAVTRLNTYNTASVSHVDEQLLQAAMDADAVAVASPSAVKALLQVMGKERASTKAIACIGSTSAKAAQEAGLSNVFYPPDPGFEGWCSAIQTAVGGALPGQPDW